MIRASIISKRGRQDPRRDGPAHRCGRALDRTEGAQHRGDRGRVRGEPHRDACRDAHRAFGADEAAAQVVAGRVGLESAEHGHLSVREHDLDGEHVRARDARREAVRTAGVRGDVAADRARLLGRRIGGVVQPQVAHGAGEIEVQDAGLDPGDTRDRVDVEHAVHLRRDDHDRIAQRRRAAGQAGAAPARHERPSVLSRDAHRGRDLVGRARPAHRDCGTLGDTRVARVQRELERLGARSLRPDRGAQIVEKLRFVARECRLPQPTEHTRLAWAHDRGHT